MKSMYMLAIVATLGAVGATAKENLSVDPTLELAKSQESSVAEWTHVATGLYEGVTADGISVSVYRGTEGARLMRSVVGRELKVTRAKLSSSTIAREQDAAQVKALVNEAALLEEQAERLTALIDHNDRLGGAKATQQFDSNTGAFCGKDTATRAIFENGGILISLGRFYPFGAVTGGPVIVPASVYRRVFTRTESGGVPVSHSANSYVRSTPVVSQSMKDDASECALRVGHSMEVQCVAGGPMEYFAITREQTCAGLDAGSPPVVYPNP